MSTASVTPTTIRAYGEKNSRSTAIILGLILLVLIGLGITHFVIYPRWTAPKFDTPYQAVLMTNGAVYFGKLDRLWTPYPVLTDVYYLQSVTNKETNQTNNILVKRGKEWHSPDHMVLNMHDVVLIEPVGATSKVAQLIAQSKQQGQ